MLPALHETTHARAGAGLVRHPALGRADLLAVVGHDLRQPLSAAIMAMEFVEELLDRASCPELARTHVGLAQRCMRQTLLLANDLLAMGEAEAGALRLRPSTIDVASLLDEARALVTPHALAKRVEILVVTAPALPHPTADHGRLLQVLTNVCGNAVKFTPAGGRITIAASERRGVIELSVTDSGPGIPDDDLPHVFDPYWRSNSVAAGTGLGLFIAKWLVEAHGGCIEARAARAGGLTVAFTIPLHLLHPVEPASGGLPHRGLPE
jgi:signal transduction histidine kinase